VTQSQRTQNDVDRLALDLPRRLPPDLRLVFLDHYPDPKFGQLIEAEYLHAWNAFATRLETQGFFELHRRNAVRPLPVSNVRAGRSSDGTTLLEQIERNRQRHAQRREFMQRGTIAQLRKAALDIARACDDIMLEGRAH
jgi:hypothetical protein